MPNLESMKDIGKINNLLHRLDEMPIDFKIILEDICDIKETLDSNNDG